MSGTSEGNKGNTNALKFKTPEDRAIMFHEYLNHIKTGYSKESFPMCDPQTFKKYLEDFPTEFDTDLLTEAEREGRKFWERMGISMSLGLAKGNPLSWIFNMKNRYHWKDKLDVTTDDEKLPLASGEGMLAIVGLAKGILKDRNIELDDPKELDTGGT